MRCKDSYGLLKKKIKNAKLNTRYSGKIFRYNTKGMYLLPRIKIRINEISNFIQRGKKGYTDVDAYSIRDWFVKIMPHILNDMIQDIHGYPVGIVEIRSMQDWLSVLETMKECFRQADETTCDDKYVNDEEYRQEMLLNGLNLFVRYFNDLWD